MPNCGCSDAARCGGLVRYSTTAFGEGERRLGLVAGKLGWSRPWAEVAGSDKAELLMLAEVDQACVWITSEGRGEAVWLDRANGQVKRRLELD